MGEQSMFEFMQCLKVLFYDYHLFDFDDQKPKYKKKLPPSIVDQQGAESEIEKEKKEEEHVIDYVDLISMGLKTQKKFLMECAFLNVDLLQCLLELRILDEVFIVDRFKNTYDFVQYESGIDAKLIWNGLQQRVFLYNRNVFIIRRMKEKELRFLFRNIVRVAVSIEFREWIDGYIMKGDDKDKICIDKSIQIQKRAEIEEKYK